MSDIRFQFIKGFKKLGEETGEKLIEETGKIVEPIITAKELLGNIKPLDEQEMAKKQAEDEKNRRSQMADLRSQISGRGVENEMEKIRNQKKKEEEEKEKIFLENLKRQREEERQKQMANAEIMTPPKHQKDKGGNKRKTQQPDQSQMSQTAEYKGKID
jgi:poly-D-alanine transfer protein DltD